VIPTTWHIPIWGFRCTRICPSTRNHLAFNSSFACNRRRLGDISDICEQ
jgi:hypothetical protein